MKCQLCQTDRKLMKAHIFPEFLYKDLGLYSSERPKQGRLRGFRNREGEIEYLQKGFPIGIYDSSILCQDCDSIIIKEFDDFGKKFFTNLLESRRSIKDLFGYEYIEVLYFDYFQLKSFIASIFFRASISKRPEFSIVNLNEIESKFKVLFRSKNFDILEEFEVGILYLNTGLSDDYLCNIVKVDKPNIFLYSFIAGGFLISLFPDRHKSFFYHEDFFIKENEKINIPVINDYEVSRNIVNLFIDKKIL